MLCATLRWYEPSLAPAKIQVLGAGSAAGTGASAAGTSITSDSDPKRLLITRISMASGAGPMTQGFLRCNRFWCRRLAFDQALNQRHANAPTCGLTPENQNVQFAPGYRDRQKLPGATWLPSCPCKIGAATQQSIKPFNVIDHNDPVNPAHLDWGRRTALLLEDQVSHLLHQLVSCLLWCSSADTAVVLTSPSRLQVPVQASRPEIVSVM